MRSVLALAVALASTALGSASARASTARAAGGADPARFVVQDTTTNALLRFDGAGVGGAFVTLPAHASGFAWGPDGNLYVRAPGVVLSYDGATGQQIESFVTDDFMGQAGPITFGPDGDLFVADLESDVIDRYCGPARHDCAPGSPQPSPGNVHAVFATGASARDLTFGPDGNLYVASTGIERFNGLDGSFIDDFVPAGRGGLGVPRSLTFDSNGYLYVASQGSTSGVFRFFGPASSWPGSSDPAAPDGTLIPSSPGGAVNPAGLDFGPDGDLYVGATAAGRPGDAAILRFHVRDDGFDLVTSWLDGGAAGGAGLLRFPRAAAGPARAPWLVIGDRSSVLHTFDATTGLPTGALQEDVGNAIEAAGFRGTAGLGDGPDGSIYMTFPGDIVRATPHAAPAISETADFPLDDFSAANLDVPVAAHRAAVGPDGRVYVSYSSSSPFLGGGNDGVAVWDSSQGRRTWFPAATVPDPGDLAFGPDGNLYIASPAGILRFDGRTWNPLGKLVEPDASARAVNPVFAFGRDGYLYVYGAGGPAVTHAEILQVDVFTGASRTFVHSASGGLSATGASALAFGPDGNLYLINGDGAVLRYDGQTGAPLPAGGQPDGSAVFIPAGAGGLDQPSSIAFGPTPPPPHGALFGGVKTSAGNAVADATVLLAEQLPQLHLVTCPFGPLVFEPCPTTTTDATGAFSFADVDFGTWLEKAFPPPGSDLFPGAATVNLTSSGGGADVTLLAPEPVPDGTTVTLAPPESAPPRVVEGVPVLFWPDRFEVTTHGCPGASSDYTLTAADGKQLESGELSQADIGTYTATVATPTLGLPAPAPYTGLARVTISFGCPAGATPTPPVTFLIYIDPSGTVVNDATDASIAGATVTLLHADSADGPFTPIPAGSALMALSNRANPDRTDAEGRFGWDVAPGFYKLRASARGYTCDAGKLSLGMRCAGDAVETGVIAVPPAALDLVLPLHALAASPAPAAPPAAQQPGAPAASPAYGSAPPVAHQPPRVQRADRGAIRARLRATEWVITLAVTLDEPATLRLRLLDSHGRPIMLADDSALGASRLRHPGRDLIARCRSGRVRISVRVPRAAGPGRVLQIVATDAEGARTSASFRIVGGQ